MDDAKEEIRARLPVEDVVGQYIELKRAGRSLKGRSPWGVDKTPSFMVSPEKGIWHDFSSNKGGDIFTFVMEVEGISFREALEKLAAQAGVELQRYSGGDKAVAEKKRRAKEALELSCKYYQFCLTKNKTIIEYVTERRGMTRGTIGEFRIGYAPNTGKALIQFLTSRGFTKAEMEAAGLLNRFGGDLFRGRMMVPFIDTNGVIGYTARVIDQGEPKYLNTPETLLFNKSRFIFGLAQAKEAIRQNNFVVIVEGNMDVISSHQAGVKEAVATSGTAMTELHLKSLSRLTPDVRLAYDGDAAGVKATERAIMMAGDLGVNLSVISDYHGAKDPDELIQKDPRLWQEAVKNYRPAVDWLLDKYEENLDLNSGAGKREYSSIALKLLKYVSDAVERKHYEKLVARKLDCSVEDLHEKDLKMSSSGGAQRLKSVATKDVQVKIDLIRKLNDTLQALIIHGGVENKYGLDVTEDSLKIEELEMVFQKEYGGSDSSGVSVGSSSAGGVKTGLSVAALEREADAIFARYKIEMNKQRIRVLTEELEKCADDEEKTQEILREIAALKVK